MLLHDQIAGVDYQVMDGQPVHLLFMIAVPANANNTHFALASLSRYLPQDGFMDKLSSRQQHPDDVVNSIYNSRNGHQIQHMLKMTPHIW